VARSTPGTNAATSEEAPVKILSEEVFRKLASTDSPTLSNAIEATHVRSLTEGFAGPAVRCMFPAMGITMGYALTVQIDTTSPGPPAIGAGLREMIELLVKAPKPAVLVYQDIGSNPGGAASFGEYIATLAQRLGVVALVTDGAVRDLAEVEAIGFQYFAAGSTVSHGNARLLRIGVPVVVDGMYVETGDIIHGDVNGVLKVPFEVADQLPALIDEIKAGEKATFEFLKGSTFNYDEALRRAGH
jgi:regulator of RNase E activity RraA